MPVDLVIKNGKLCLETGLIEDGAIAIVKGRITGLMKSVSVPKADTTIDAQGNLVMPGTIDPHVHLHDDWISETASAAVGGTTLVMDHTLGPLQLLLPEGFKNKIHFAQENALVDFGIHSGIIPNEEVLKAIPEMTKLGAMSFKMITMGYPPKFPATDDATMLRAMELIAQSGGIANVHAENKAVLDVYIKRMKEEGRLDPLAHPESRPSFAEGEATTRAIQFAEFTGCPLYISHMSAKEAVNALANAKRRHVKVFGETCPQYLLFTTEDMKKHGPYLKYNPPTRTSEHPPALWRGLKNGTIDTVGTDHGVFSRADKEIGWKDIWAASPGCSGVATKTALMLTKGVLAGKISLKKFLELCCMNPAKIFGLYPQKGTLQSGSDADIIIVDIKQKEKVSLERCKTKAVAIPFEGWELSGWPTHTIVRGNVVYEKGAIVGKPGLGKYIAREVKVTNALSDD
jgi:D-hydantoinase